MDEEIEKECLRLIGLAEKLIEEANHTHNKTVKKELLKKASEYEKLASKIMEEYGRKINPNK